MEQIAAEPLELHPVRDLYEGRLQALSRKLLPGGVVSVADKCNPETLEEEEGLDGQGPAFHLEMVGSCCP